jgi:hypothetical protein
MEKKISPVSIKFSGGVLADMVQLVEEEALLTCEKVEGEEDLQTFKLRAKLKLKEEVEDLQNLDEKDITMTLEPLKVNLLNDAGKKVKTLCLAEDAAEDMKKLLQGKKGDILEVTFEAVYTDNANTSEWFDQTFAFAADQADNVYPIVYNLDGNIGKYPVRMTLIEEYGNKIMGAYYYKKYGSGNLLYLIGERGEKDVKVYEYTPNGNLSGYFDGHLNTDEFSGEFDAIIVGGHHQFKLLPSPDMETLNFEGVDFNSLFDFLDLANSEEKVEKMMEDFEDDAQDFIEQAKRAQEKVETSSAREAKSALESAEAILGVQGCLSKKEFSKFCELYKELLTIVESL